MENLEEKKRELRELVEHFKHNVKEKQIEKYDETDTRIEFINKFFKLLGWDVDNEKKRPIEERQVVSEDKVSISGKQKSPDYGFYIKGKLRFFVEAKKPSVNIKYDVGPAFQVRRYGYSARLPISILTDFEEFAIYDTRIKPNQNDDTSVARVDYFTLDEYEEKFAELLKNISPAAIEGGSFDEYTDEIKNKKGTSEVDKELLKSIESWREKLAKNITLRNDDLKLHEINLAVQKIIDRIIFLRIAEDKEIEDYETLLNATKNENIYKNLNAVFIQANKKYNAGLFMPVEYLDNLSIDDNVLKDIIKGLYYPESPYEFSVLPIEILGSIYEQFLGKTIRFRGVRGGRQTAIIEEKPEVKKAGGVYYTPQYIVRYIIEQTLLKKIKSKTPKQIKNLTVLDPACGSGSFLVQVYETLLDYYLNFYSDEKNVKQALKEEKIFEVPNTAGIKEYRLKIEEKKEILLRHIYGVDIDEQAVEVTKLSLCLKLLENESSETRNMLFRYSDLKVLPDLSNNIKSGNSLVGNDYYDDNNLILLDLEAMRKINVFDWETEFPEIFKAGGFDVILGNPPYVNVELLDSDTKTYLFSNYKTCKGRTDMYIAFIEKALSLLKQNGEFSFIIPYAYTNQNYAELSRKLLIEKYSVQEIVDTANYQVFKTANVKNIILRVANTKNENTVIRIANQKEDFDTNTFEQKVIKTEKFKLLKNYRLETKDFEKDIAIKEKIERNTIKLESIFLVAYGVRVNNKTVSSKPKSFYVSENKKDGYKPFVEGRNIERYYFSQNGWLNYKPKEHYNPMFPELFENEKIMFIRIVSDRLRFAYDNNNTYNSHTVINCVRLDKLKNAKHISAKKAIKNADLELVQQYDTKFILAILNSSFINWYFLKFLSDGLNFYPDNAKNLPIPTATPEQQEKLASLAQIIIELKKKLAEAKVSNDKRLLTQQAEGIDKEIDKLVYQLYGLNDEEIKVIEEN